MAFYGIKTCTEIELTILCKPALDDGQTCCRNM